MNLDSATPSEESKWSVHKNRRDVVSGTDRYVAFAVSDEFAAQIVREHNAHRPLADALRRMVNTFSPFPNAANTEQWREEHQACECAVAALALVDGPQTKSRESGDSSQATHGIKSPTLAPDGTARPKIS